MYNAVTNDWKDFEHQLTFDVRQPKPENIQKSVCGSLLRIILCECDPLHHLFPSVYPDFLMN